MAKAKADQLDMLSGVAAPPAKVVEAAQQIWNEFATLYGWRKCNSLDKARQAAIKRALGDYGGLTGWREALAGVSKNRFVQGLVAPTNGHRQFKAHIDWFCYTKTVRQFRDEWYEDEGADQKRANGSTIAPLETEETKWGRYLKDYRPGRFWASSMGPRPEDPACRAPADLLKWWREQHKVAVAAPERETKAERLRGMVASYRRPEIGKWERANELEIELAAIEERPAVLIAAPDVAGLTGAGSDRRSHKETRVKPMVFDVPPESPAEQEREKRIEFEKQHEPPPWNPEDVPEDAFGDEA